MCAMLRRRTGRTITIASKNSSAAIRKYLGDHRLSDRVRTVFGRNDDPALMNPAPTGPGGSRQPRRRPARVRLHGDSGSDVLAGRLEGVPVIGYPNKPGKAEALTGIQADAVTSEPGVSGSSVAWKAQRRVIAATGTRALAVAARAARKRT
jgi:hypothetical protein